MSSHSTRSKLKVQRKDNTTKSEFGMNIPINAVELVLDVLSTAVSSDSSNKSSKKKQKSKQAANSNEASVINNLDDSTMASSANADASKKDEAVTITTAAPEESNAGTIITNAPSNNEAGTITTAAPGDN
jgi:hypothetical protein